jgi:hypothetical protein
MPTKHIDTGSWKTVENLTIKAVGLSGKLIKETDMIRLLIAKGAGAVTDDELRNINGFTPRYGVLRWALDGSITDLGTVSPESFSEHVVTNEPFMIGVYGLTATGKSSFKDRLLACLPGELKANLAVHDPERQIAEEDRIKLFSTFFEDRKSVIFVEHSDSSSSMITRCVNAMVNSKVNFVFVGEEGEKRKMMVDKIAQVMRQPATLGYSGKSKE